MTQVPAVGFMEAAIDVLKSEKNWILEECVKEFYELGSVRMREVREFLANATSSLEHSTEEMAMAAGFLLGLETAYVLSEEVPKKSSNKTET